jgi:membrane protease YdiL (CAAX protease family)
MPNELVQQILAVFEISLLLAGAFLVFRLLWSPQQRNRWFGANQLPHWTVTAGEFGIFVFLVFGSGVFFQLMATSCLKGFIAGTADHEAIEVCLNGGATGLGGLAGWRYFRSMQRGWHANHGAEPPPAGAGPARPVSLALLHGGCALLAALPVVTLVNIGWIFLLRQLGLPDEPQTLLAIFENARSPFVVAGLLVVACGLAPLYEELLFRGGLYRFCRQKLGRGPALLLSGCLFGAMHTNLASFLPLSVFGMCLALAYECTGDIRVAIIAHSLFNLNTVLILLSGLS